VGRSGAVLPLNFVVPGNFFIHFSYTTRETFDVSIKKQLHFVTKTHENPINTKSIVTSFQFNLTTYLRQSKMIPQLDGRVCGGDVTIAAYFL